MSSVLAKRMPLRSADLRFFNVFGNKIRRKLALHSGILLASKSLLQVCVSFIGLFCKREKLALHSGILLADKSLLQVCVSFIGLFCKRDL